MKSYHLVAKAEEANYVVPKAFAHNSQGFRRWTIVNRETGSVHQEFNICELEPGGSIDAHVQTYEESVYVMEGQLVCETGDGAFALEDGGYGVVHVAAPHALRNDGDTVVRWAEMLAPQPRIDREVDTFEAAPFHHEGPPLAIDARDPRTRFWGKITTQHMNPGMQTQDLLDVSASMRTALLVYSGITLKMMVDSDLGAYLHQMFMVQYEPDGKASSHDHPFEETYLILDGETDAWFDGVDYRLKPGDVAWSGVGCIHGFRNPVSSVRWLETSVPQPPSRYAYRFARDWDYLEKKLSE
jgi:quercetin dioxygenase-like cupin family protein